VAPGKLSALPDQLLGSAVKYLDVAHPQLSHHCPEERDPLSSSLQTVREIPGSTIRRGIPGTPTPDPISTSLQGRAGTRGRKRSEAMKRPSTISAADLNPVSLWLRLHATIRSRYRLKASC
jgi:hypothetical protein